MTAQEANREDQIIYSLDLRIPDESPQRIRVEEKTLIGSNEDCDIQLEDFGLAFNHCIFRIHNDILSIHNLAEDGNVTIGDLPLQHGKMYIVDKGDKIKLGEDVEIFVRKEEMDFEEYTLSEKSISEILDSKKDKDDSGQGGSKTKKADRNKSKFLGISFQGKDKLKMKGALGGFFGKKSNDKNEAAPKKLQTKKQMRKMLKFPGALSRALSIALNFAIVYFAIYKLVPILGVQQEFNDIFSPILRDIKLNLGKLPQDKLDTIAPLLESSQILLFILFYVAFDFTMHLVLGKNLGLTLLGVKDRGGLISTRLKGIIRFLIHIVTWPITILDLPLSIGRKSFKEVITLTDFRYENNNLKVVSFFLLIPSLICLCLYTEFAYQYKFVKAPKSTEYKVKINKSASSYQNTISNALGLKLRSRVPKNTVFIPLPRFIDNKLVPNITYYNYEMNEKVSIELLSTEVKYENLIKNMKYGDPLFQYLNPRVDLFIKGKPVQNIKFDIYKLVMNSYDLSLIQLPAFIVRQGPFVSNFLDLRKEFEKSLELNFSPSIEFYDSGTARSIALFKEYPKAMNYAYLALFGDTEIKYMKLVYRSTANKVAEKFMRAVGSKFSLISKEEIREVKDWSSLEIFDFYTNVTAGDTVSEEQIGKVISYYFSLCKLQIENPDKYFKNIIIQTLKGLLKSTTAIVQLNPTGTNQMLLERVQELHDAFENFDVEFFKAKPENLLDSQEVEESI